MARLLSRVFSASIAALSNPDWLLAVWGAADTASTPSLAPFNTSRIFGSPSSYRPSSTHPDKRNPRNQVYIALRFPGASVSRIALLLSS